MPLRHSLRKLELALHDFGVFEVCLLVLCHSFPKQQCKSRNAAESRLCKQNATNCLTRLIAAILEAIFFSQLLDMTTPGKVCINEYT